MERAAAANASRPTARSDGDTLRELQKNLDLATQERDAGRRRIADLTGALEEILKITARRASLPGEVQKGLVRLLAQT